MLLLCCYSLPLASQFTANYWSHQYGSKGLLLNGAVIASSDEETSIFYNPAGMNTKDDVGISVSLITPTFSLLQSENVFGTGTSLSDSNLGFSPGLVAFMFSPKKSKKITIGFTAFNRFRSDLRLKDRELTPLESNPDFLLLGDVDFGTEVSENWYGVGFSYKVSKALSLGITQYITWRSETFTSNLKKEVFRADDPSAFVLSWRDDQEYKIGVRGGLLTKLGLLGTLGPLKYGLTLTSNTYLIANDKASYEFEDQRIGEITRRSLSNSKTVELLEYNSPISVGFGLELKLKTRCISVSAEYFEEIEPYVLLTDTDFPLGGLPDETEQVTKSYGKSSERVLNVAIGLQSYKSEKITYFYGFRTDYSPSTLVDIGDDLVFLSRTPDIFHLSAGVSYNYSKSKFSLGLDYGYGNNEGGKQLIDLADIAIDNIFNISGPSNVNTNSHQFTLFITYDL
jgi:hypothetical protein